MRLVKEGKILTLIQKPTGSKKDFGLVGFHPRPFAVFLAFPKRLKDTGNAHVIGIKYELLRAAKIKAAEKYEPKKPKLRVLSQPEEKPADPENGYEVAIIRSSSTEIKVKVVAKNVAEAKAMALSEVSNKTYAPNGKITDRVISISLQKDAE